MAAQEGPINDSILILSQPVKYANPTFTRTEASIVTVVPTNGGFAQCVGLKKIVLNEVYV